MNRVENTFPWKHDTANRLTRSTTHVSDGGVQKAIDHHAYGYDALDRIESHRDLTGATWNYGYNAKGEVSKAVKTLPGGTQEVNGRTYRYHYDEIGNRLTANDGTTTVSYFPNAENQYSAIAAVSPTYDDNGSLLNDGRIQLEWQESKRMDKVTDLASNQSSHYRYDAMGRRTEREDYDSLGNLVKTTRYLFSGWNCIAEFEVPAGGGALVREKTYTWGLDLSESMQGAGGVGGLLAVTDETAAADASYHFAYDGNGNVIALYDATLTEVAAYEYDPFGQIIAQSGTYASANTYRFSTKPQNTHAGALYYYGYRYYDPVTGRWPSRDPIEESGGVNLYALLANDAINQLDAFGLMELVYEANDGKHRRTPMRGRDGKIISTLPTTDPQKALNHSSGIYDQRGRLTQRIHVNRKTGEIIVFRDHTSNFDVPKRLFHGYSVPWDQLHIDQKNVLIKNGFFTKGGRILLKTAGTVITVGFFSVDLAEALNTNASIFESFQYASAGAVSLSESMHEELGGKIISIEYQICRLCKPGVGFVDRRINDVFEMMRLQEGGWINLGCGIESEQIFVPK